MYLESLGVVVEVGKSNFPQLRSYVDLAPIITYVDTGELRSYRSEATNHAVIVVGIDDKFVYVHDPDLNHFPQKITITRI